MYQNIILYQWRKIILYVQISILKSAILKINESNSTLIKNRGRQKF
jgi:hypothetical protein